MMVSSDMEEILGVSDRVVVMQERRSPESFAREAEPGTDRVDDEWPG